MAERRSRRRKREEEDEEDEEDEPNDEQTEVAKHLRFNCQTKSSNYQGQKVDYFKGSKAIDCLLDSKWASGKGGSEILFTDRESVQDYLQELLELGMFKRVTRIKKKKKGEKDEGKKKDSMDSPRPGKGKKDTNVGKDADGKKIKVKVKLEIHDIQEFLDGEEVYMWIFDPVHPRTIIYGVLVVIGAVVICLFPLWPAQMREYTWYLSVGAAILLGALIVVALFRYVLFAFVWGITAGRHHFWLLPNLTEDCGVVESFLPLYTHTDTKAKESENEKTDTTDDKVEAKDSISGSVEELETKDNNETKDEDRNNEGPLEQNEKKRPQKATKDTNETESWINLTQEDVAQAKEATGGDSDVSLTPSVTC